MRTVLLKGYNISVPCGWRSCRSRRPWRRACRRSSSCGTRRGPPPSSRPRTPTNVRIFEKFQGSFDSRLTFFCDLSLKSKNKSYFSRIQLVHCTLSLTSTQSNKISSNFEYTSHCLTFFTFLLSLALDCKFCLQSTGSGLLAESSTYSK